MSLLLLLVACGSECDPGFERHAADPNCYAVDDPALPDSADDTAGGGGTPDDTDDDDSGTDDTAVDDTAQDDTADTGDTTDTSTALDADGDGYPADVDCDDTDPGRHPGTDVDTFDVADTDCDGLFAEPDAHGSLSIALLDGGGFDVGAYPNMFTTTYEADLSGWSIKEYEGAKDGALPPMYRVAAAVSSPSDRMRGVYPALEVGGFDGSFCLDATAWVEVGHPVTFTRVLENIGTAPLRLTERYRWGSGGAGVTVELPELAPDAIVELPARSVTAAESQLTVSICSDGASAFRLFEPGLWHSRE